MHHQHQQQINDNDNVDLDLHPSKSADELIDFTCATPWERLALDIELELRAWNIHDGRVPTVTTTNTSTTTTTSNFTSTSNTTLSLNPKPLAIRHLMFGSSSLSLQLICTPSTSFPHTYPLQRFFGVSTYLLLSSTNPEGIVGETFSECSVLLSALCVATQACHCIIPFFIPVGRRSNLRFMGRQQSGKRFSCDVTHNNNNHNHNHTNSNQYRHVAGLLNLFHSKQQQYLQNINTTTTVFAARTTKIAARFVYEWNDFQIRLSPLPDSPISNRVFMRAHTRALVDADPVKKLRISAIWHAFPTSLLQSNDTLAAMPAISASLFRLSSPISLSPSPLPLTMNNENNSNNNEKKKSVAHLINSITTPMAACARLNLRLAKKAAIQQQQQQHQHQHQQLVDQQQGPAAPVSLIQIPHQKRTRKNAMEEYLSQVGKYVEAAGHRDENIDEEFLTSAVAALFETDLTGSHGGIMVDVVEALGPNATDLSIVERVARLMAVSESLEAAQRLWNLFLDGIETHWEHRIVIPGLHQFDNNSNSNSNSSSSNSNNTDGGGPDHHASLVVQKLQMINCCVKRLVAQDKKQKQKYEDYDDDDDNNDDGPSNNSNTIIGDERRIKGKRRRRSTKETNTDGVIDLEDMGRKQRLDGIRLISSLSSKNNDPDLNEEKQLSINVNDEDDDDAVWEPFVQAHPLVTRDMVEDELQRIVQRAEANVNNNEDDMKAKRQSLTLKSDMMAFKAANPKACLADFVRWFSPSDWNEETHSLSIRMSRQGNVWEELWKESEGTAAHLQAPLFDASGHGSKALADLRAMPLTRVFTHMANIQAHCGCMLLMSGIKRNNNNNNNNNNNGSSVSSVSSSLKYLESMIESARQAVRLVSSRIPLQDVDNNDSSNLMTVVGDNDVGGQNIKMESEYCEDMVARLAMAEHCTLVAISLLLKLPPMQEMNDIVDQLVQDRVVDISKNDPKGDYIISMIVKMAGLDDASWRNVVLPKDREFVISSTTTSKKNNNETERGNNEVDDEDEDEDDEDNIVGRMYAQWGGDDFRVGLSIAAGQQVL